MRGGGWACAAVAVALLLASPAAAQHWAIEDPGQGPVTLPRGAAGANELSGISWAGGDRWAAVSDADDGRLYWLRIAINPADGRITSATVDGAVPLPQSSDLEGVALQPGGSSVVVTDEVGPFIREYSLPDGQLLRAAEIPPVFATQRYNLSFEVADARRVRPVLDRQRRGAEGRRSASTAAKGTIVRILRLDRDLRPTGQWAYLTDPVAGARS
jgi:hypothetical protein